MELSVPQAGTAADAAWSLVRAAAHLTARLQEAGAAGAYALDAHLRLARASSEARAVMSWDPQAGWRSLLPRDDERAGLLELYLPICSASLARPLTVGHLGQSLDGFIATRSGDSQFVTGDDNLIHMHRLRALCDAIVVGAGTVAADNPQLTTRRVSGPNPVRVIVDPQRRLEPTARVFTDEAAPTLYFCEHAQLREGEVRFGNAVVIGMEPADDGKHLAGVLEHLKQRGCARIFVEGGGVTVSAFLEANLLDRLQIAVAPMLIGDGRPAIRLTPPTRLRDCRRPAYRVFRMGSDILFDCDLRAEPTAPEENGMPITRVI